MGSSLGGMTTRKSPARGLAGDDGLAGPVFVLPASGKRQGERSAAWRQVCMLAAAATIGLIIGVSFKAEVVGILSRPASHLSAGVALSRQAFGSGVSKKAAARAAKVELERLTPEGWARQWTSQTVCDDSCPTARDGHCGDGRSENGEVLCDLGTDCSDCGSWTFPIPEAGHPIPRPIAMLRERGVMIKVKQAATWPPFRMAYTDPQQDVDVSEQLDRTGVLELGLTQMWYQALNGNCKLPDGTSRLVLDVGSNFGWYSFFSAVHGCRVVAWEPVPLFRGFLYYGLQVNNLTRQVAVRERVVSNVPGKVYKLTVPLHGIWGTASVDGNNIDEWQVGDARETVETVSERVDDVIHEDALVIKLDVEGFEPPALRSMDGVFSRHRVDNFFMEYSPGVYEHARKWAELHEVPDMLLSLVDRGFTILHVNDTWARGPPLLEGYEWKGRIPPLEEVTRRNIEFDLLDTQLLREGTMGCYSPKELVRLNPGAWAGCNRLPENLHPKGFRGIFGHNTNIWASPNRSALAVGRPVGVQDLDAPDTEWYGRDPEWGMGMRRCSGMREGNDRGKLLLHRCRCTSEDCRKEAALVEKYASKKQMGLMSNQS